MPRTLLFITLASLSAAGAWACNHGCKESSEKQLQTSMSNAADSADELAEEGGGSRPQAAAPETAGEEESGQAAEPGPLEGDEGGGPAPELPDMSGLSGLDPDSLPDGDEGLDAAVALWTTVGEEAKNKVDAQDEAQAGKELVDPGKLAKGLPKAVAGWKAVGKTAASHQKHRGFLLPMASRVFTQPDGVLANVTIMDTLKTAEIRVGFEMGLAITQKVKSPRQKVVTVGSLKGYVLVREASPEKGKPATSKGALLVKDRFLVVVNADNLADFDAVLAILSSINVKQLEALDT
jgi:hypothetical protein